MATIARKPLQGVGNIIRFNWPFYCWALLLAFAIIWLQNRLQFSTLLVAILLIIILVPVLVSLLVSAYVYDCSNLYDLDWLSDIHPGQTILNIHAGFDETSCLLHAKFPEAILTVADFYDPARHTEASIRRARKAYPAFPNTIAVEPARIPMPDQSFDSAIVIFAAHEIRDPAERITFFKELRRVLQPGGQIIVTEHLRDGPNFLAYTIGFLHFYSRSTWLDTFNEAGLRLVRERKITPFISSFILQPHESTL
jgi:ubiquinone/menaquinone biosynthesis C-methylase UbiE